MDAYTLSGKMITLEEPAIKSGGEGAVYNIIGHNNVVAKIYLSKKDAKEREKKICEMSGICKTTEFQNSRILDDIAWPLAPLFNKAKEFIGFGMSRIMAKFELDDIYSLSQRTSAGMSTLERIKVLISLCSVVEKLHRCDQVFGDFNPNNIKIDDNYNVKFVDSDSYHFRSQKSVFPCVVCAPGYVAPELMKKCKGSTYSECFERGEDTFTKDTDNFSLAIHCFRMLMNGCHPFTCKKEVKGIGSTPSPSIDKRVENGESPFFVNITGFSTPDWAPEVSCLPMYLQNLFKRAFVSGHSNPSVRPSATEWKEALNDYLKEIQECASNPLHYYWKNIGKCPYCEAEEKSKKNIITAMGSGSSTVNNSFNAPVHTSMTFPSVNSIKKTSKIYGAANTIAYPNNSTEYWLITIIIGIVLQLMLSIYVYGPIFLSMTGEDWVMYVGAIGCFIAAMVGMSLYGSKYSGIQSYKRDYELQDYVMAQLTGIGFAIGFGFILVITTLVVMFIISAFAVIAVLAIIIGALSS